MPIFLPLLSTRTGILDPGRELAGEGTGDVPKTTEFVGVFAEEPVGDVEELEPAEMGCEGWLVSALGGSAGRVPAAAPPPGG